MNGRRGFIELQFNWIFILIVGAIILLFFISIVQIQKDSAKRSMQAKISTTLKAIFTGNEISAGTTKSYRIRGSDIGYGCDGFGVGVIQPFKVGIAFAPSMIKQGDVTVRSLEWSMPYKITNFFYVTSPEVRYILVYDSSTEKFANEVFERLPPREYLDDETGTVKLMFNKEIVGESELSDVEDQNNYMVRIISFAAIDPGVLESNFGRGTEVSFLDVDGDESSGSLIFYRKSAFSWEESQSEYLGMESLMGAIFTDDPGAYECSMLSAMKKMELITRIYYDRTDSLLAAYKNDAKWSACKATAANVKTTLSTILGAIPTSQSGSDYASVIAGAAQSISERNEQIRDLSCPVIY